MTQKLKVVWWRFTYQTTVLLSGIHIFLVTAVCKIQLMSYFYKYAPQPPKDITFCAYLYSELENYRLYVDIGHIEWLLCCQRYPFSGIELNVRYLYDCWDTGQNTHHRLFPINHLCVLTCITWKQQVIYKCVDLLFIILESRPESHQTEKFVPKCCLRMTRAIC